MEHTEIKQVEGQSQITYAASTDAGAKIAAQSLAQAICATIAQQEQVNLAVCGGRSVQKIFLELAKIHLPWEHIHLFLVDERLVPLTDNESNFQLVQKYLLQHITIPAENVHPFVLDVAAQDHGVGSYVEVLQRFAEQFDVLLLSAGEDGHVAGLFPHFATFESEAEHFTFALDAPKPPPQRMTMTRKHLLRARSAVCVFFGEGKKDALHQFLAPDVSEQACPAKLIKQLPSWTLITDIPAQ